MPKESRKRGTFVPMMAAFYISLLVGFGCGVHTMVNKTWPYPLLARLHAFTEGDPHEQTTLTTKLASEFGDETARQRIQWHSAVDRSLLREVAHPALRKELDPPLIYTTKNVSRHPKAFMTSYLFNDAPLSVMLLDDEGNVQHRWNIQEEYFDSSENGVGPLFAGDFVVLDDGSIVAFVSNRPGLFRIDFSGKLMWRVDGLYHHHMSVTDDDCVWALGLPGKFPDERLRQHWNHTELLQKIDLSDGRVVKTIHLLDVMKENLHRIDPLLSRKAQTVMTPLGILSEDIWHPNDVEVLPESIADKFPDFTAGDLALSFLTLNLVLVIDPETLEIKWWSQGATQLQHDPDWQADGTLSIFNNRFSGNFDVNGQSSFSDIQRFDFQDELPEQWVDGADYQCFTDYCGGHDVSPDGRILITSTAQGRVFEIDQEGNICMEYINRYSGNTALWTGVAYYVDPDLVAKASEREGIAAAFDRRKRH